MAHRQFARSGQRRATEWLASADQTSAQDLAASTVAIDQALTGAQVSAISPFTITRTVGMVAVAGDQVAALEFPLMAIGAMVVRETARAGGVGNVPTPITEEGDDGWFLYLTAAASSGTLNGAPASIFQFDSRAQRKVEDGDAVVWTVENSDSAAAISYWLKFRMLIKVH